MSRGVLPAALTLLGIALAVAGSRYIVRGGGYVPVMMLMTAIMAVLGFVRPRIALGFLVFSMLLSPEIRIARMPGREVVMRADDFLLVVMFFAWLARIAVRKEFAVLVRTELHVPMFIYLVVGLVSLLYNGFTRDYNPLRGGFYLLKYAEYFMLYAMVVNLVETRRHAVVMLALALITAVIVTVFVYTTMGTAYRTSAPFEAPIGGEEHGEPASLGGYYLVIFGALTGFATQLPAVPAIGLLAMLLWMLPPFAMTLSRASYMGLAVMSLSWFLFSGRRWIAGLVVPALAYILVFIWFPQLGEKITNRLRYTIEPGSQSQVSDIGSTRRQINLEPSAQGRVIFWRRAFRELLPESPILGFGPGCGKPVEGHLPLLISETGVLGVLAFLWIVWRAAAIAVSAFRSSSDPLVRGTCAALLISFVALVVQGIGVNNIIIVRIMEPLMLLTGVTMVLAGSGKHEGGPVQSAAAPA